MFVYVLTLVLIVAAVLWLKKPKKVKRKRTAVDAIVLSGPSGAGKGTLIDKLMNEFPDNFAFSVSHTSRAPRDGEVNGVQYHFASKEKIEAMKAKNEFLELCEVHGNYYGTSKKALEAVHDTGKVCIIECDVQGAQKLKKQQGEMSFVYIFIKAPSLTELENRIRKRNMDTEERIKVRLETAKKELEFIEENDMFYDKVMINDNLDNSYTQLKKTLKLFGGLVA